MADNWKMGLPCSCGRESGWTGLYDTIGKKINAGNVVHWSDGGDDLPLGERIRTRWDRIAVVSIDGILPQFTVIDSPSKNCRPEGKYGGMRFCYGSFIYKDTGNHLTVVAEDEAEYRARFPCAGDCMAWVLEQTKRENEHGRERQ